ncbi:hypothetical protein GBF38_012611 [Nibea albiflora]|uniref:Uncharacterized protein n=1 Tax=Nibea albiflora TaxID=240163 RepID=A0ACB7EKP9_NIBAL|nr:hypothetical protein GBF38_012611 [Nibea albiflora]
MASWQSRAGTEDWTDWISGGTLGRAEDMAEDETAIMPLPPLLSGRSSQLPLIVLLPVVISALPVPLALAMMSGAEVRGREDQVCWSWRRLVRLLRYLCLSCC